MFWPFTEVHFWETSLIENTSWKIGSWFIKQKSTKIWCCWVCGVSFEIWFSV